MRFDVVTLFPGIFEGYLGQSLLHRAIQRGLVDIQLHNLRDWAQGKHKNVDDRPFGGGPGMVLKVEPIVECVEQLQTAEAPTGHVVMLTPQGQRFGPKKAEELAARRRLILLCGRYEGFDERVRLILRPEEVSIGDFVLNGGEVAAMVLIDSVIRWIPGVLGDEESSRLDSFSGPGRLLEHAQYTRPREYRGHSVPEVLVSGDHQQVDEWRNQNSQQRTRQKRPDLISNHLEENSKDEECPS